MGIITKQTPTVTVAGVQQYAELYYLRIVDGDGNEVTTIPLPNDRAEVIDEIARNIRASLKPGYTLDYNGGNDA